jgi:hypothetical protein
MGADTAWVLAQSPPGREAGLSLTSIASCRATISAPLLVTYRPHMSPRRPGARKSWPSRAFRRETRIDG